MDDTERGKNKKVDIFRKNVKKHLQFEKECDIMLMYDESGFERTHSYLLNSA